MGGNRALLLLGVVLVAPGCFGPSAESQASLAQVKKEGRELERRLDDVEGRLLGNQAMVLEWQELGRRHQEVSAIACGNAVAHTAQMVALHERQLEKERAKRRGHYAVREGGVGGPAPEKR